MPAPHVLKRVICSQRAAVVAPATFTTWNPADKSANLTMSGGDLTATFTGFDGFSNVRAVASHSSGKFYHEMNFSVAGTLYAAPGIANGSLDLNSFIGNTNGIAWLNGGQVYLNNSNVATVETWVAGDTLCIAVDTTAKLIWFRKNAGNWNNDVSANPATGTNGIDISGVSGPYFPSGGANNVLDAFTANFGATAYAQSAPSGFGNW
jgi:hypothetical protein